MSSNKNISNQSLVTGITLALGVLSGSAMADQVNPFSMTELAQGYTVAAAEAKCGEGKCGGNKPKTAESKCGGDMAKDAEAKCGAGKDKAAEARCGAGKDKAAEAKCGAGKDKAAEAKCGGAK